METINLLCGLAPDWASSEAAGGLAWWGRGLRGPRRRCVWGVSPEGEPSGHPAGPAPRTEVEEQGSQLPQLEQNVHFRFPGDLRGLRGLPVCVQHPGGRVGLRHARTPCAPEGRREPTVVVADLSASYRHMS